MFCSHFESAQKAKQEYRIQSDVDIASGQLKLLHSSGFFNVYPLLDATARDFEDRFAHYLDNNSEYLVYAAECYFSKFFQDIPENPQIDVKCQPKQQSGAQVSFAS